MGWNSLNFHQQSALLDGISEGHVYFVHSYYVKTNDQDVLLATSPYDVEVPAVVGKEHVFGTQFHLKKQCNRNANAAKLCKLRRKGAHRMSKFEIYPAIDMRGGKCVRLLQGDYTKETVYGDSPVDMAAQFASEGAQWIHMVDLDGAKAAKRVNDEFVLGVKKKLNVRVQIGGGIRSEADVAYYLENGIDRVILGSAAISNPEFVKKMLKEYGARIVVLMRQIT